MDKPKCCVKTFTFNCTFFIAFLTQHLGLSLFYPNLGSNNPAFFRVYLMNKSITFFLIYKSLSKNCWVVWTQHWVKYGQTQPLGCIFYYIFNPMFGFVHIWPRVGLKQPSMFRVLKYWIVVWSISVISCFFFFKAGGTLKMTCRHNDVVITL